MATGPSDVPDGPRVPSAGLGDRSAGPSGLPARLSDPPAGPSDSHSDELHKYNLKQMDFLLDKCGEIQDTIQDLAEELKSMRLALRFWKRLYTSEMLR
jgi:hypothetical protein